jgi:hypothetical protein
LQKRTASEKTKNVLYIVCVGELDNVHEPGGCANPIHQVQINSNSIGSQSIVEYGQFVKDWFLEKGSDATGTSKIK